MWRNKDYPTWRSKGNITGQDRHLTKATRNSDICQCNIGNGGEINTTPKNNDPVNSRIPQSNIAPCLVLDWMTVDWMIRAMGQIKNVMSALERRRYRIYGIPLGSGIYPWHRCLCRKYCLYFEWFWTLLDRNWRRQAWGASLQLIVSQVWIRKDQVVAISLRLNY